MLPDSLSVSLRTLSFIGVLQAAGAAVFLALFGHEISASIDSIRSLARYAAYAGVAFVLAHGALEAARMAGEMPGVFDASLQRTVLHSSLGVTMSLRILGLLLIAGSVRSERALLALVSIIGVTLVVLSFAMTGHTSVHTERWLLAPLLVVHLLIVAFWFGALVPLYVVSRHESAFVASHVVDSFSRVAVWLVPGIFVAGLALALVLVPNGAVLRQPYGELLFVKVVGFAALMALAALNKWRFGPQMARADVGAAQRFRRVVLCEAVLIVGVLIATADMTTFFSPDH